MPAFLFLIGLAALGPSPAGAQTGPADLPPPPSALQRELGLTLSAPAAAIAPGSSASLSSPIEIPFVVEARHTIVEASIDGTAPKPFMFDTGARITITPEIARTLNAAVAETERIAGIGPKISQVDRIKVGRIAIGPTTLDQQTISTLNMPNIIVDRGSRPRLPGLIGSELLACYAVSIDFGRRVMTLNSLGYRPKGAAFSLPLELVMLPDRLSHPSTAAELDGVAGDFMIDTGASGEILLSEKFQQEHRPFAEIGPILRFLSPGGIGGHVDVQMGFGKRLRIGPSTLSPPLISGVNEIRGSSLGHGMASQISGVIGAAVLAQFRARRHRWRSCTSVSVAI